MPDILTQWPFEQWWIIPLSVIFVGSLVDLIQFSWLCKRFYGKMKRRMYSKIKAHVLAEELKKKGNP